MGSIGSERVPLRQSFALVFDSQGGYGGVTKSLPSPSERYDFRPLRTLLALKAELGPRIRCSAETIIARSLLTTG